MASLAAYVIFVTFFGLISEAFSDPGAAAAKCVAMTKRCTEEIALKSGHCKPLIYVRQQPAKCVNLACQYCQLPSSINENVCNSWGIQTWCPLPELTPTPSVEGEPPSSSSSYGQNVKKSPQECLWLAVDDRVVINLARIPPVDKWTREGDGWIWNKEKAKKGIDAPGSGEVCLDFSVQSSGSYYVTAISSAPHVTDHNDLWIKMQSGLSLYHAKTNVFAGMKPDYVKAYQNEGGNKISKLLSTVDHNPHIFVAKWLNKGEKHTVCISGRSSKFIIFKLVLVKCNLRAGNCWRTSEYIGQAMRNLVDSICE